ncbi:protein translocase subunit SecF [Streptomyces sp. WAC 00631]|uniref:protein translocase subunit SecF n=1 Tax=unclassified Streptomyces TaxID=2593676 RepID=UPI000F7A8A0D|nr:MULTISPECIES: protein translocase subunit SecF [unclassified Streptomyces]MCC5034017.1 protein translocase subunit SecF [Streptomyces sp. WAC 00631]MCC9742599.1 protein translocase subunit SecF [Streptomyces sp. MNU89]
MSRLGTLGGKLYRGELSYDFVGRRKFWYGITLLVVITALAGLGVRGLYLGIEFQGGAVFTTQPSAPISVEQARETVREASGRDARVQELGSGALRIQVTELTTEESGETREALAEQLGIEAQDLNVELVGPSWGDQMTTKALQGLVVFLALVSVYLAIAFEWRMSVAALVALLHDLIITVGVYAIVGFEVTPGTVVGVLTILGYSLYDTVVVFDKVKEKTQNYTKQTRYTYGELANLGINATVIRSVNTSVVALLPVAALLFIGSGLLGGGMLKDIALSLFVGLAAGTFSSIMIATPISVDLRLRQPDVKAHDRRVLGKRARREAAGEQDGADGPAGEDTGREDEDWETGAEDETDGTPEPQAAAPAGAASADVPRPPAARGGRGRGRASGRRR